METEIGAKNSGNPVGILQFYTMVLSWSIDGNKPLVHNKSHHNKCKVFQSSHEVDSRAQKARITEGGEHYRDERRARVATRLTCSMLGGDGLTTPFTVRSFHSLTYFVISNNFNPNEPSYHTGLTNPATSWYLHVLRVIPIGRNRLQSRFGSPHFLPNHSRPFIPLPNPANPSLIKTNFQCSSSVPG
jgi:hypothetical protein